MLTTEATRIAVQDLRAVPSNRAAGNPFGGGRHGGFATAAA
jgi:hypothetical protein